MKPRVLVLRAAGTNCDEETRFAFARHGAAAEIVTMNDLLERPERIADYDLLALPGGFSYGDDIAAGKVLALELTRRLGEQVRSLVERGGLVLGICNGFQALVRSGLLPGGSDAMGRQEVTLAENDSQRYEDRWVTLEIAPNDSPFLRGVERMRCPVAHAEGKYLPRDERLHEELVRSGRVALRYRGPSGRPASYPFNPNGSHDDVAGLIDPTGRILGLMPHPERALFALHHPDWPQRGTPPASLEEDVGDGDRLFLNAVDYLRG